MILVQNQNTSLLLPKLSNGFPMYSVGQAPWHTKNYRICTSTVFHLWLHLPSSVAQLATSLAHEGSIPTVPASRPLYLLFLLSGIIFPNFHEAFPSLPLGFYSSVTLARTSLIILFKIVNPCLLPNLLPCFIFLHKIYLLICTVYFAIYVKCCLPCFSKCNFHERGDPCLFLIATF